MTQSVELTEGGKSVQFTDRRVPWMKLGEVVDGAVTAHEAAVKGGLNFKVSLRNVYFTCDKLAEEVKDDDGSTVHPEVDDVSPSCLRNMTNRKIVVRDDTLEPLSIVSSGYPVLQYHEAFNFMDEAMSQFGGDGARYVAAGSLKGGRQGFMVVRLPQSLQVKDRKSTRLNSSHMSISYAVFCLK